MTTTDKAGVTLDWNLITMIGTIVFAVISTVTWFENRFDYFEATFDSKYATKQELLKDNIKIFLRQAEVTLENLEVIEKEIVKMSGYSETTIKAFRDRKSQLRKQVRRNMEKYLDE